MSAIALDDAQLGQALTALPGWTGTTLSIERTLTFATFADAMAYMQACMPAIERLDHHPEWSNIYNRVTIRLRTHDAGDRVTAKDAELATILSGIARERHAR
jgi:4a-hydroxytetrahydrobiopterin dehydratase